MAVRILRGDCREVLRTLPDESVQCCVTSPPYWRQRDYGNAPSVWGGNDSCNHDFEKRRYYTEQSVSVSSSAAFHPAGEANSARLKKARWREDGICRLCGAWFGSLGLEDTPERFVAHMVQVFREVNRVLRSDGTCFVNIGDKWASGGNGGGGSFMDERSDAWAHVKQSTGWRKPPPGYKDKDLVGVPFMLAMAMRADGWFWRQCNIWAKPNCMPESVSDRSTASHEYVLHFSKENDYFYNAEAARTPIAPSSETRLAQDVEKQDGSNRANGGAKTNGAMKAVGADTANLRSVWWISPAQYREGHYAVMPDTLAEICIACGTLPRGTVLDPFGGAGTTGLVADRLGRDAILIELNPEYAAMAERRLHKDAGMFSNVTVG